MPERLMHICVEKDEFKALPSPCHVLHFSLFSASSRLHNNVNYKFIQNDTTCTDGRFVQPEQWKPRTQGAVSSCRAQPGLLQGSGGNPIPPTPVLPREHFQLKQSQPGAK